MPEKQPHIPYDYKWMTGDVLPAHCIDTYNLLTDEINRMNTPLIRKETKERLLDERHRFLSICLDIEREVKI